MESGIIDVQATIERACTSLMPIFKVKMELLLDDLDITYTQAEQINAIKEMLMYLWDGTVLFFFFLFLKKREREKKIQAF